MRQPLSSPKYTYEETPKTTPTAWVAQDYTESVLPEAPPPPSATYHILPTGSDPSASLPSNINSDRSTSVPSKRYSGRTPPPPAPSEKRTKSQPRSQLKSQPVLGNRSTAAETNVLFYSYDRLLLLQKKWNIVSDDYNTQLMKNSRTVHHVKHTIASMHLK